MSADNNTKKRVLSVFSLVMINIIAVDSLRTLPFSAKLGSELVVYYIICALCFFLPVALVTAELATAWPKNGGLYVWVREAFGVKLGFLVVWLQWIYNVVWYPTVLGVVAGIIAYLIEPSLADNRMFICTTVLVMFWLSTLINFWGMKISGWISTVASIFGTLLPMTIIIALGGYWVIKGQPTQIPLDWASLKPTIHGQQDMVLLTTVLFGLMGLEMSAVHAQEVKDPSRDYPMALKISCILILLSLVFSSLSVAIIVPQSELSIVTGLIQAFKGFCSALNMLYLLPGTALAIIVGAIGSVATWIIGPTKALFVAASDRVLPGWLAFENEKGVPIYILLIQGIIVSCLTFLYTLLPSVEIAYLFLTELTAILALLMYTYLFGAAIKLRYSHPEQIRPYRIPFGNVGIWIIGLLGGGTCLVAIYLGFIPPSQIDVINVSQYQGLLMVGVLTFCLPAFLIHRLPKKALRIQAA